jgi:hypothetical protein
MAIMTSDEWNLFIIVFFSAVGFGYFIYGKKQRKGSALLAGLLLMVYPYFISSTLGLVLTGLLLMAGPLAAKRFDL